MMLRRLLSPSALPGRRALFVLTAAVSLCAALAGFTAPAQAQSDTEVWSGIMKSSSGGTLPAGTVPSTWPQGEHAKGYWNLAGGSGGTISKNTFTEGSVTYTIKMLAGATNSNQVYLELDKALPAATRNAMTLHLSSSATTSADDSIVPAADDVALTLSTATLQNSDKRFYWPGDTFLGWYHNYHYRARLTKTGATSTNAAPAFSAAALAATTQSVAENTAADTDIGSAYTATDADTDDTLTYSLGGTDAASFAIDTSTGQLKTKAALDHETKSSYTVTVKVSDGTASATIAVTVTVTDVVEPPGAPDAPTVTPTSGSATSLDVSWEAPANTGPAIESYDLRYRKSGATLWIDGPQDVAGKGKAIAGLDADTKYEVQVRATNDEDDSAWSASGEGTTAAVASGDPTVTIAAAASVSEADDEVVFTLARTGATTAKLTVKVQVTEEGTVLDDASAYSDATDVEFSIGEDKAKLVVALDDDSAYDPDLAGAPVGVGGRITATLKAGTGYTLGTPATHTVDVTDDEDPPLTAALTLEPASPVAESVGTVTVVLTVETDAGARQPGKIYGSTISSRSETALSAEGDFEILTAQVLVPPSEFALDGTVWRATLTWTIDIYDDDLDEENETFRVITETPPPSDLSNLPATDILTVTIVDNDDVPGAPTNLGATAGDTKVTLRWAAPTAPGTSSVTRYDYRRSTDGGNTWGSWTDAGNVLEKEIAGLTNGTEYTFEVRAVSAAGNGAAASVAETPAAAVAGDNKPATGGTVTISGTRAVGKTLRASVSVTDIMDADGLPDGNNDGTAGEAGDFTFTYQWIRVDGATGTDIAGATESSYLLVADDAGKTVKVRVGFTDGAGNAETLESGATGTIGDGKPEQLGSFRVSSVGDGKVTLFLSSPNNQGSSILLRHEVRYKKGEAEFGAWQHIALYISLPTITSLTNGVEYTFEGRAVNSQGAGPSRTVKGTPVGLPEEITDLTATANVAAGQVVLRWTAPADSGSPITKYQYRREHRVGSPGAWTDIAPADLTSGSGAESNVRSYTVTGLTNPRNYSFNVRAVNANGAGDEGVDASAATAPDAPGLTLTAGDRHVVVAIAKPVDPNDGGRTVSAVRYRYKESTDAGFGAWTDLFASDPRATVGSLANGAEYAFQAQTGNEIGWGRVSATATATPRTVPSAPVLTATAAGERRIDLRWSAPDDGGAAISGYELEVSSDYSDDGNDGNDTWTALGGTLADSAVLYAHDELAPGTENHYRLRALNEAGDGAWSVVVSAATSKPTITIARDGDDGSGSVSEAVGALTYTLTRSDPVDRLLTVAVAVTQSGDYIETAGGYTAPSSADFALGSATASITVRIDDDAVDEADGSVTVTVGPGATYDTDASSPLAVTVTDDDVRGVALSKTELEVAEGGSATYTVALASQPTGPVTVTVSGHAGTGLTPDPSSLSFTASNWNTPRDVTVSAGEDDDTDDHVVTLTHTASGADYGAVTAALAVTVADDDTPTYALSFGEPRYEVAEGAGTLAVTVRLAPAAPETVLVGWATVDGTAQAPDDYAAARGTLVFAAGETTKTVSVAVVNDRRAEGAEVFGVRLTGAMGAALPRPAEVEVEIADDDPHPGMPAALVAAPGNGEVSLSWSPPGAPLESAGDYQFRFREAGDADWSAWTEVAGGRTARGHTVKDLANGTAYEFEVRWSARTRGFGEAARAEATPRTVPGAPRELEAAPGNGAVTLTWRAPADDGGARVTRYEYRHAAGAAAFPSLWTRAGADLTVTVGGLDNDTGYRFEVRAVNAAGAGVLSASAAATPRAGPSAPREVTAEAGDAEVALSWKAPAYRGASAIVGYEVRWRPAGGRFVAWTRVGGARAREHTVTALTNGRTYEFEVRAVNGQVAGAASAPEQARPVGVPGAPGDFRALPTGSAGELALRWRFPALNGADLLNYRLRRQLASARSWEWGDWATVVGPPRHTVKGLTDGTAYNFELKAVNGVGAGAVAQATGTPGAQDLAAPVLRRASVDGAVLRLLFNERFGYPLECNPFTVRVNGAVRASRVSTVGGEVNLALTPPVRAGDAVTVDYEAARACLETALRDESGNRVEDFHGLRVLNGTPADEAAPVLSAATVEGAVLRLVWDEPLDGAAVPPGTAFTVSVGGGARAVARVSVEGAAVVLRLAAPVLIGEAVTVGYAAPARGGVRDRSGNPAADFAPRRVDNRTQALRAPRPVAVALGSSPAPESGGVYAVGANIVATVRFDRAVEVSGAPVLDLVVGEALRAAAYIGGAPGTVLRFGYRVAAGDADDDGVGIRGASLRGGTIAGADGAPAGTDNPAGGPYGGHRVDTEGPERPVILQFGNDVRGASVVGDAIDVVAVWIVEDGKRVDTHCTDGSIAERCGTPYVRLTIGGEERRAWYAEADRASVRFRYVVRAGDDGAVRIDGRGALQANGGAITDPAGNPTADLRPLHVHNGGGGRVDTAGPALTGAVVNGTLLTLTWSERLRGGPDPSAFTVRVDGAALTPAHVRRTGNKLLLYLSAAVSGGAEVTADYRPPPSNALADGVGNEAEGFSDEEVTNNSPAVAPGAPAALSAVPGNGEVALAWEAPGNDGGSSVTGYEVRFGAAGGAFGAWTAAGDGEAREHTVRNLDNGTEYAFELRAVNAVGAGEAVSAAATPRAGSAAPGLPRGFEASADDGAVLLRWEAPASDGGSSVTGYEVRFGAAGGAFGTWRRAGGGSAREYTVRDLDNGTEYAFELRAVNAVGAGEAIPAAATPVAAPGRPVDLTAAPGNGAVALTWEAPSSDGGSAVVRYEVRRREAGGAFGTWTAAGDGAARAHEVRNLDNGTAYGFELRAVNRAGLAGAAASASATPAAVPSAPALSAQAEGRTAIRLDWSAPGDGGSAIERYELEVSADGAGGWTPSGATLDRAAVSWTDEDLTAGTTRHYRLRAVNGAGDGAWSAVVRENTDAAAVPSAPVGLEAARGEGAVTLTWRAPASDGGAAIERYEVRHRAGAGAFGTWARAGDGAARTYTVPNLDNATAYEFELRAVNAAGAGAAAGAGVTPAGGGTAPSLASASVNGATLTMVFDAALDEGTASTPARTHLQVRVGSAIARPEAVRVGGVLVWLTLAAPVTSADRVWVRYDAPSDADGNPVAQGALKDLAGNLAAGFDWTRVGNRTPAATVPAAPALSAETEGRTAIRLEWSAPDAGGSAILRYELEVSDDGAGGWTPSGATLGPAAVSWTDSGLEAGTTKYYRLRAVNGVGDGAWSAVVRESTDAAAVPSAPALSAEAEGRTAIRLDWSAPADGGSAILRYELEVSDDGAGGWTPSGATLGPAAVSWTDGGLEAGTTKYYRLRAVNGAGDGAWSAVVRESTDAAAPPSAPALNAVVGDNPTYHSTRHTGLSDRPQVVVTFNRAVAAIALDTSSVELTGATLASVSPLGETAAANDWVFYLVPDGAGPIGFTLRTERPCGGSAKGICSADGAVLSSVSGSPQTIPGPSPAPLQTLSAGVGGNYHSADHGGPTDRPQVVVTFNRAVAAIAPDTSSVVLTGATLASVWPLGATAAANDWIFYLVPDGTGPIEFELLTNRACGGSAKGICSTDGAVLSSVDGSPSVIPGRETAAAAAPTVTGAALSAGAGGAGAGEAIEVTVRFSEPVTVDTSGGTPSIGIVAGGAARRAPYARGSGTASLVFAYTVRAEDGAVGGARVAENALSLDGGTIRSGAGVDADLAYDLAPAVTAVSVVAPGDDGRWDAGDAAEVAVRFSEAVTVETEGGTPSIGIEVGAHTRRALYARGSGTAVLAFAYTVTAEDGAIDGVAVPADGLVLGGGTIRDGSGKAAVLAHEAAARAALPVSAAASQADGPALRVADARAREGVDAAIGFTVTLAPAATAPVTVDYASADRTAKAGEDYVAANGTLTFAPGETEKRVAVAVLDDAHDEGEESFVLRLSNASGAELADAEAVGTIVNSDHMPKAWLARFGRTVTGHVLDAVEARLEAPRAAGGQATLAGQALPSWNDDGGVGGSAAGANDAAAPHGAPGIDAADRAAEAIRTWLAGAGAHGRDGGAYGDDGRARFESRGLTGREFVTGTSFALTGGSAEGGGFAALWGRGAMTRFDGREGDLTLDGEVTTGLLGADWAAERWTAGLALGHSTGTGGYREGGSCAGDQCGGRVEATLTGVYPYAGLTLTDRLSAWAAAGYGAGELTLIPEGVAAMTADLAMSMGAAGLRSELLKPENGEGLALAVKGDARFTRTSSKAVGSGDGKLEAADADVWLLRTGIEGARRFALGDGGDGAAVTPSVELGLRLDGGDAETGVGADMGGGLAFADPRRGLVFESSARGLIAHEASGFREWGASVSFGFDPRPETERGLALSLTQSWGASPSGGMDALLGRETLAGLAANDDGGRFEASSRLEGELGFGLAAFGGAFTGTPNIGFGLSDNARDYRLGWRLTSAVPGDPGFEVSLDATRRETANDDTPAEHGIMLRGTIRW